METSRKDICVIVEGMDGRGRPVQRAVKMGYETILNGDFHSGFDIRGPVVSLCHDCGEPQFSSSSAEHTSTLQKHYSAEHDLAVAMLP